MSAGETGWSGTVTPATGHSFRAGILALALLACSAAGADDPAAGLTSHPLAPRPFPRGATMFTMLPAVADGRHGGEQVRRPEDVGRTLPGIRGRLHRHRSRHRRLRRGRPARHLRRDEEPRLPALSQPRGLHVRGRDGKGGRRGRAGGVEPRRHLRRPEQQRAPGHLRLPVQRAEPALYKPGGRDVQGDGPCLRARHPGLERDGRVLRLRPRRVAGCVHHHQHAGQHGAPERPEGPPPPQQPKWHVHRRLGGRGDHWRVAEPFRDVVGL